MRAHPILLVGESPNRATVGRPALWLRPDNSGKRHTANRLLAFTGWTWAQYMETFERTNLFDTVSGHSAPRGRYLAQELVKRATRAEQSILILGRLTAQHFGVGMYDYFVGAVAEAYDLGERATRVARPVWVCPHPSGLNRWWNDPANVARAREFFDDLRSKL